MADRMKAAFGEIEETRVDGVKTRKRTGTTRAAIDAMTQYENNRVVNGCVVYPQSTASTALIRVDAGAVRQNGHFIPVSAATFQVGSMIGVNRAYVVVPSTQASPTITAAPTARICASHATNVPSLLAGDIVLAKIYQSTALINVAGSAGNVVIDAMIDNDARPRLYKPYGIFTV